MKFGIELPGLGELLAKAGVHGAVFAEPQVPFVEQGFCDVEHRVVRPPGSRRLLQVLPDEDRVPAHRSLTSDSDPEVDVLVPIQTSSPSGSNPLIPGEDPAEYRLEGQIRIAREVSVYEGAKEGTVHNIGVCWAMPAYPRRSPAIASTRDRLED